MEMFRVEGIRDATGRRLAGLALGAATEVNVIFRALRFRLSRDILHRTDRRSGSPTTQVQTRGGHHVTF